MAFESGDESDENFHTHTHACVDQAEAHMAMEAATAAHGLNGVRAILENLAKLRW